MKNTKKRSKAPLLAFMIGIINGLFGGGGGMIAVYALRKKEKLTRDKAHATALVVMLPLSIVSICVYFFLGHVDWQVVPFVAIGLLPGSLLGAKLLGKISTKWLRRIFSISMLAAGLRLLF